jgi:hypothetical protein
MGRLFFTVPEGQRGVQPVWLPDTERKDLSAQEPLAEEWRHGNRQGIRSVHLDNAKYL